jgi:hypothetical protein
VERDTDCFGAEFSSGFRAAAHLPGSPGFNPSTTGGTRKPWVKHVRGVLPAMCSALLLSSSDQLRLK